MLGDNSVDIVSSAKVTSDRREKEEDAPTTLSITVDAFIEVVTTIDLDSKRNVMGDNDGGNIADISVTRFITDRSYKEEYVSEIVPFFEPMYLHGLDEDVFENDPVSSVRRTSAVVNLSKDIIDAHCITSAEVVILYGDKNDSASLMKGMVKGGLFQEKFTLYE